jgi:hypothetical protein
MLRFVRSWPTAFFNIAGGIVPEAVLSEPSRSTGRVLKAILAQYFKTGQPPGRVAPLQAFGPGKLKRWI